MIKVKTNIKDYQVVTLSVVSIGVQFSILNFKFQTFFIFKYFYPLVKVNPVQIRWIFLATIQDIGYQNLWKNKVN